MARLLLVVVCCVAICGVKGAKFQNPLNRLIAFGNSFTDNGADQLRDLHGFRRFCNGPVWVDYLAHELGIEESKVDNYAYSGALSGLGNYYFAGWSGVLWQINQFLANHTHVPPRSLIALELGGINDLVANISDPNLAQTVVQNGLQGVRSLLEKGADKILVLGLWEDAERAPVFSTAPVSGLKPYLKPLTMQINQAIQANLVNVTLAFPAAKVVFVNAKNLWTETAAKYSNLTHPFSHHDANTLPTDMWKYAWFDEWHPNTGVHRIIASTLLAHWYKQ